MATTEERLNDLETAVANVMTEAQATTMATTVGSRYTELLTAVEALQTDVTRVLNELASIRSRLVAAGI